MAAQKKGRKFTAMCIGVGFGLFMIVACMINTNNLELLNFAMTVEGIVIAYMGANVINKKVIK